MNDKIIDLLIALGVNASGAPIQCTAVAIDYMIKHKASEHGRWMSEVLPETAAATGKSAHAAEKAICRAISQMWDKDGGLSLCRYLGIPVLPKPIRAAELCCQMARRMRK